MFITIITAFGGLLGITKNILQLRVTFRDLFKERVSVEEYFPKASKNEKKVLINLYKIIELGKPLNKRIFNKLILNYSFTLIFIILFISIVIYLFRFPLSNISYYLSYIIPILILPIIFFFFSIPIEIKYYKRLEKIKNNLSERIAPSFEKNKELLEHLIFEKSSRIKKSFQLISFVNSSEREYLDKYIQLCSLKDSLEMYFIDQRILETKAFIVETFSKNLFYNILSESIERIIESNRNIKDCKEELKMEISNKGLGSFLLIFDDDFFEENFNDYYEKYGIRGIKEIIKKYW